MGFLANLGLESQGYNAGQQEQQSLDSGQQSLASGQQKLQTQQIGLDELKRQTGAAANIRAAVSGADPNTGRAGIYDAVQGAARQSGDVDTYAKAQQASMSANDEGMARLARDAVNGVPPEQVEKNWGSVASQHIKPGSLEYGRNPDTGDILVRAHKPDGTPLPVFNASAYIRQQQKTVKLAPGEALVPEHGGAAVATNAPLDKWKMTDGVLYNSTDGTTQQVGQDWVLGSITNGNTEVPVLYNKRAGQVQQLGQGGVRTGLEAKVTQSPTGGNPIISLPGGGVAEFKPATEGSPGKSNLLTADVPAKPATPAIMVPVNNAEAPPVQGAQKAPDGNWYVNQNGKYLRVNPTQTQQPVQQAQPPLQSTPATPAVDQAASPNTARQQAVQKVVQDSENMKSITGANPRRSKAVDNQKQELNDQFDDRVKDPTGDNQTWLENHKQLMNPSQLKSYRDAKAKILYSGRGKYKSGGKVGLSDV